MRPQGGDARQLQLPALDGCRRTRYLLPHQLPDGRLGLSRLCETQDVLKDHFDLVAVDAASGELEQLATVGLDPPRRTWQADLRHGFVALLQQHLRQRGGGDPRRSAALGRTDHPRRPHLAARPGLLRARRHRLHPR